MKKKVICTAVKITFQLHCSKPIRIEYFFHVYYYYYYCLISCVCSPYFKSVITKIIADSFQVPNKVLIANAMHHFNDPKTFVDKIIDFLPNGGVFIHAERTNACSSLPFARVHLQAMHELPTANDMIILHLKQRNDVVVETLEEPISYEVKKERWYSMIRGRFFSRFEKDTDEELEMCIEELEKERFGGLR